MLTITDEKLIHLAGKTTFEKGLKLYQSNAVTSTEKFKNHILATVLGSQLYTVDLTLNSQRIEGACSCPASDYMDFCKHCVAVALSLKATQDIATQIKSEQKTRNKYAPIEPYIASLSKPRLQEELLKLVLEDNHLTMQWLAKAESALGLLDYKTLRKKVTAAIPYKRHLYTYDSVRNYFIKAELLAQQLIDSKDDLLAEERLKLAEYALQRITKALETIDDSGGFRLESQYQFNDLLLDAFKHLNWDAKQKADWLLTLSQSDNDLFPSMTDNFWPLLSSEEQTTLAHKVQTLWDNLPDLNPEDYNQKHNAQKLQKILVEHAKNNQQFATVIQLHEKTARDFHEHTALLKMEIDYHFYDAAERRLVQLRTQFTEPQYQQNLYKLEAALAQKQQQHERVLSALWNHYSFSHSLSDLQKIITLAEQYKNTTDWIAKAEERLLKQLNQPPPPGLWHWQPATHLAELYFTYGQHPKALQVIKEHPVSDDWILNVIRSPDLSFMDVWPLYQKIIVHQIEMSNNEAYRSALALMKEVLERTNILPNIEQEEIKQWLLNTREQFKRKRNFAQWFDAFWIENTSNSS